MGSNDVDVGRFCRQDETKVRALLAEAGLPQSDLGTAHFEAFLIAKDYEGRVLGAIGLERHGTDGLLRSLVVAESRRGIGLGKRLTRELEDLARSDGLRSLYLLTMTVPEFFRRLGYAETERAGAPALIARTAEFRSLCPDSAVCMCKAL